MEMITVHDSSWRSQAPPFIEVEVMEAITPSISRLVPSRRS
jgi:hypothetical protein